MLTRSAVAGLGLVVLLAACTAPRGAAATSPGAPGCRPSSPTDRTPQGVEVQGTAVTGGPVQLWGLLFSAPPFRVGDDVKIAWRMTGAGDLTLAVTRPDGTVGPPDWGPEPHSSSSFGRPGDEWGSGYHVDQAGCWTLHAARGTSTADVWLQVAA